MHMQADCVDILYSINLPDLDLHAKTRQSQLGGS